MKATYSPEDNKLRLYADGRLDPETYAKVKAEGFRWAPKQDLFVAPAWSPSRADLMVELCGSIEDEDTTLEERQEQRAERFETYQEKRVNDAESAYQAVSEITDNIPLGQPILVGHHSEKRARKDAEKIERTMQKAVKTWETSEYWKYRAAGALRHSLYKERADVRARRIKKLGAEKRKYEKYIKEAELRIKLWSKEGLSLKHALILSGSGCGAYDSWRGLDNGTITVEQAKERAITGAEGSIKYYSRWVEHTGFRIDYETTLLGEQGRLDLIAKKPRPKQLPLLNYRAPEGIDYFTRWSKEPQHITQIEMTKAEYQRNYHESRYTAEVYGSHRVRILSKMNLGTGGTNLGTHAVFLTDSKVHPKPETEEVTA